MTALKNAQEKEFAHRNGLTFHFIGSYADLQETDNGYIIQISPRDSRQANQIAVEYRHEKPANLEKAKKMQGQKIYYREQVDEGGSGGSEATLQLWKTTDQGKGVYVEHYRQAEQGADFNDTWVLMLGAQ